MWTIGEVKREGWSRVKAYYWPALLVTIITGILGGSGGSGIGFNAGRNSGGSDGYSPSPGMTGSAASENFLIFTSVLLTIMTVMLLAGIVLKFFVGNPVQVGKDRFFMESRYGGKSAGIGKVFWAFKSGHYLNIVKIMFLRDLYTTLWTFLLIIPGVIKSYEYAMIPYILSENPDASASDVFALTKDMMTDNKFQLFCLELSFLGWLLLGFLACCIGVIFVTPYTEASMAEVYAHLRGGIGNFPFRGFGVDEEPNVYKQVYNNEDSSY